MLNRCKKKDNNTVSSGSQSIQKYTVSGTVHDTKGNPLSGYKIKAKESFSTDYAA